MRDDCAIFLMMFTLVCIGSGLALMISYEPSADNRLSLEVTMAIGAIFGALLTRRRS